jgi:FO synthase
MDALISSLGRIPRQRTTLYEDAQPGRRWASYHAPELTPMVFARGRHAQQIMPAS